MEGVREGGREAGSERERVRARESNFRMYVCVCVCVCVCMIEMERGGQRETLPPTHLLMASSATEFTTLPLCLLLPRFLHRGGSGGWSAGPGCADCGCVRANLGFWRAWRRLHTLAPVLVEEVDEVAALGALVDFRLRGHRDSQLGKVAIRLER